MFTLRAHVIAAIATWTSPVTTTLGSAANARPAPAGPAATENAPTDWIARRGAPSTTIALSLSPPPRHAPEDRRSAREMPGSASAGTEARDAARRSTRADPPSRVPPDPPGVSPGRVDADPEVEALKQLYDQAHVAFLAGRYEDAATMFDDGYTRSRLVAFLFNSAVAWERAERTDTAVERYAEYLVAAPDASDRESIAVRLDMLRRNLQRKRAGQEQTAMANQMQTKGVAIVTTTPAGAQLRLDDPDGPVFATAPFRGTLPPGKHVIHVSAQGYRSISRAFPDNQGKVLIGHFSLSEEYFLGHLEIKSTVPEADVFLLQRTDGEGRPVAPSPDADIPVGRTPFSNQLPPGRWRVRVAKPGYQQTEQELDIRQGKVATVNVRPQLISHAIIKFGAQTPASVGAIAHLSRDEPQRLCELPCEASLPVGEHTIVVRKPGKKPLEFDVRVRAADFVRVDVQLEPKTRRLPAVVTAVMTGGAAVVGTVFAWQALTTRRNIERDLDHYAQIDADDPRVREGWRQAIVADACFAGAAILGSLTLYYLFRETGEPSQGRKHQHNLARRASIGPRLGPGSVGLTGQVRF
ncbi:MAG: PEGA domain-containing protein [Myxococcales bacterium FL481]|nr:MAG: PEGA domain-containing protein [Myxococcales bacterium FL481]